MEICKLILHSCTNSPEFLAGLCSEKHAKLLMCVRERLKFEAPDTDIKEQEMSVTTVEEDAFIDIKLEETSVVKFEEEILVDTKEDFLGDLGLSIITYIL